MVFGDSTSSGSTLTFCVFASPISLPLLFSSAHHELHCHVIYICKLWVRSSLFNATRCQMICCSHPEGGNVGTNTQRRRRRSKNIAVLQNWHYSNCNVRWVYRSALICSGLSRFFLVCPSLCRSAGLAILVSPTFYQWKSVKVVHFRFFWLKDFLVKSLKILDLVSNFEINLQKFPISKHGIKWTKFLILSRGTRLEENNSWSHLES